MDRIRKSDVLKGVGKRDSVKTSIGDAVVRPLTDAEIDEVEGIAYEGLSAEAIDALPKLGKLVKQAKLQGKKIEDLDCSGLIPPADMLIFRKNEARTCRVVAAYGLSCDGEEFTPEDVGKMPSGVPAKISEAVMKLTGEEVTDKAVNGFRPGRGPADVTSIGSGRPAGTESGTADAAPEAGIDSCDSGAREGTDEANGKS